MRATAIPTAAARVLGLVAGAVGSVCGVIACLTAPPPDLPAQSTQPQVLYDAVQPPAGFLSQLPGQSGFTVPVQVSDPTQCQWSVFVNGALQFCRPCPTSTDAGVVSIEFGLSPTSTCGTIRFLVADQLTLDCVGARNSSGGEPVTWTYGGAACQTYDAGDGAFPDADAGRLVVPETGSEP